MYFYIIAQKIKNTKILHNNNRSLQDEILIDDHYLSFIINSYIMFISNLLLKRRFSMSIFQKIVTILYKIDYDSSFKVFPTKLKKYSTSNKEYTIKDLNSFYINYFEKDYPKPFSKEEICIIYEIAKNFIIEIRDDPDKNLVNFSRKLSILFAQDFRTKEIGFDIQEYSDYFIAISLKEREKLANKLISDWEI